ncbi:hypothetical protein [Granulicella mallensis]|uniref:Uncharacterized protein n=1 Tax=Granulicella mallensis TaxID=940614 RepID=A0A7W7ZUW3_9BACT|nr:hypothetical protein [Granulicella mallensis]MBB5066178.1 hypothetical protein [Granulicella mallensis]
MANVYDAGRLRLTVKEKLALIISIAFALGSFDSHDAVLVVPSLSVAAIAFVLLCIWHKGNPWNRLATAIFFLVILVFAGRRSLRHTSLPAPAINTAAPAPQPLSINQNANNSDCSNIVAGGDVNNCTSSERAHVKNKH